jgi:hypothetical protein
MISRMCTLFKQDRNAAQAEGLSPPRGDLHDVSLASRLETEMHPYAVLPDRVPASYL